MPETRVKLLIVDDEVSIRTSLSLIFSELAYCVRSAGDGYSALLEIQQELPDILLSDLNMPGMSGFELLWVVRRQFPTIHVIAMSGSLSGTIVPPGVAADAFFQKGTGPAFLIKTVDTMTRPAAEQLKYSTGRSFAASHAATERVVENVPSQRSRC